MMTDEVYSPFSTKLLLAKTVRLLGLMYLRLRVKIWMDQYQVLPFRSNPYLCRVERVPPRQVHAVLDRFTNEEF